MIWILTYTYNTNSNKLSKVVDAVNDNTSALGDFKYDPLPKAALIIVMMVMVILFQTQTKRSAALLIII